MHFSLIRSKTKTFTITTSIQHCVGGLVCARAISNKKKLKAYGLQRKKSNWLQSQTTLLSTAKIKFIWKCKRSRTAKTNSNTNKVIVEQILSYSTTYYKATIRKCGTNIKTVLQINEKESSVQEIDSNVNTRLIRDKIIQ